MNAEEMKATDEALEALVDKTNLVSVLERLVSICEEKADHIRSNWQDPVTANCWRRAARTLNAAVAKLDDI